MAKEKNVILFNRQIVAKNATSAKNKAKKISSGFGDKAFSITAKKIKGIETTKGTFIYKVKWKSKEK